MLLTRKIPNLSNYLLFYLLSSTIFIHRSSQADISPNPHLLSNILPRHPQTGNAGNGNGNTFSGAIYIQVVNTNGVPYPPSQVQAQCPAFAPQACENINVGNWCCPLSNSCFQLSSNVVGCCQSGETCYEFSNGQFPAVTTVIVTLTPGQQTPAAAPAQSSVAAQSLVQSTPHLVTSTTAGAGVLLGTLTTTVTPLPTGCFTLTMDGSPVPTVISRYCSQGVAIVSAGNKSVQKVDLGVLTLVLAGLWAFFIVAAL